MSPPSDRPQFWLLFSISEGLRPVKAEFAIRVLRDTLGSFRAERPEKLAVGDAGSAGHRPGNLCSLSGTYVAFAKTRAERLAKGDPRKSLAERYKNHDGYVKAVEKAARKLVHDRLLLEQDVRRYVDAAAASDVLK